MVPSTVVAPFSTRGAVVPGLFGISYVVPDGNSTGEVSYTPNRSMSLSTSKSNVSRHSWVVAGGVGLGACLLRRARVTWHARRGVVTHTYT